MNLTENICSGSVGKWKWISNNSAVRLLAAYGNKVCFFPFIERCLLCCLSFRLHRGSEACMW